MIRWTSPVRSFFRWAQEDVELGGTLIPKGDVVLTSYPSANRDDDVFVDPMRFDIARPDADKLLSFGLGVHYCLGSQVARREVRTMLAKVLERVDTIELAGEPAVVGRPLRERREAPADPLHPALTGPVPAVHRCGSQRNLTSEITSPPTPRPATSRCRQRSDRSHRRRG